MRRLAAIFLSFAFVLAQEGGLEDLSLEELLKVKVESSAQKVLRITQAPSVIRVITADQIRAHGYRSVGEALRSVPGLYVSSDYVGFSVNVRGVSNGMRCWSRIVKVMIDGQPVSFGYSDVNFLGPEFIPIDVVDRIEVILGTGSALYGSDAFLCVVNVVTKTGSDVDGFVLRADAGTENSKDASFAASFSAGKKKGGIDYVFAVSGVHANRSGLSVPELSPNYEAYKALKSEDDLAKPISFFGKLGYKSAQLGEVRLSGGVQYLNTNAEFADWGPLTHQNTLSVHNYYLRLGWERRFKRNVYAKFYASCSGGGPGAGERLDYGSDIHYEHRDFGYLTLSADAQLEYSPSDKISIAGGARLVSENYELERIWSFFRTDFGEHAEGDSVAISGEGKDTTFSDYSLYTQAIYNATPSLSFTQGLVYDKHSAYGDFWTVRFGAVYKFSEEGRLKFLFGSSFNVPSPQLLFAKPLYPGDVVGNPELVPEQAKTFDIELTPLTTEDISVSFDAFYNLVYNKLGFAYEDGIIKARNYDNVKVMGVEGELRWSYKNFTTRWTVSYQHTKRAGAAEGVPPAGRAELVDEVSFEYPRVLSYSSFVYSIPKLKLAIGFEQQYVGERNASQPNIALNGGKTYKLGAYQIYNLNISTIRLRLLGRHETKFTLTVRNLTDESYVEPGYNGLDVPGMRRTVYLGVSQVF